MELEHNLKTYVSGIKNEIKDAEKMIVRVPENIVQEYHTGRKRAYLDALDELKPIVEGLQNLKRFEANEDYKEGFIDAINLVLGISKK